MPNKSQTMAQKAKDWLAEHNVFSRFMIIVSTIALIYAIYSGNATMFEIAAWLFFGIFVLISVGINSLQMILDAFQGYTEVKKDIKDFSKDFKDISKDRNEPNEHNCNQDDYYKDK